MWLTDSKCCVAMLLFLVVDMLWIYKQVGDDGICVKLVWVSVNIETSVTKPKLIANTSVVQKFIGL